MPNTSSNASSGVPETRTSTQKSDAGSSRGLRWSTKADGEHLGFAKVSRYSILGLSVMDAEKYNATCQVCTTTLNAAHDKATIGSDGSPQGNDFNEIVSKVWDEHPNSGPGHGA